MSRAEVKRKGRVTVYFERHNVHHILFYTVVDNYLERRAPFREEHLALVRQARERGELLMAGALAEPADGAVLIFRGESPQLAEAFVQADPYVANGLVTSWRIRKWTVVAGGDVATAK
jgi:uncharacterized protein